jgi:hypothetical protein
MQIVQRTQENKPGNAPKSQRLLERRKTRDFSTKQRKIMCRRMGRSGRPLSSDDSLMRRRGTKESRSLLPVLNLTLQPRNKETKIPVAVENKSKPNETTHFGSNDDESLSEKKPRGTGYSSRNVARDEEKSSKNDGEK